MRVPSPPRRCAPSGCRSTSESYRARALQPPHFVSASWIVRDRKPISLRDNHQPTFINPHPNATNPMPKSTAIHASLDKDPDPAIIVEIATPRAISVHTPAKPVHTVIKTV